MRSFAIISFFLFPAALFAQENVPVETPSRFSIGISGSADYCYRSLIAEDTAGVGFVYTNAENSEIPAMGYSAGITSAYHLTGNWSLDAGIKYTQHRYKTDQFTFTDVDGNSIGTGYFSIINRFISVPIGVHRSFNGSGDRIGFIAGLSIIPQYTLGVWTRGHYDLPDTYDIDDPYSKDEITKYNMFTVAGNADAGAQMSIGKITLQALAGFQYNFMKQAQDVRINRQLWSAGIEFRILYHI